MKQNQYAISSPLIRIIVFRSIAAAKELLSPLPVILPINRTMLDVPCALTYALTCFDSNLMKEAVHIAYKTNEAGGDANNGTVPNEHCYLLELATVLKKVFM